MATEELSTEIGETQSAETTGDYPVNMRFTVPFYPRSFFVTLIIGREKRSADRLREERVRHPLDTWGNIMVAFGTGTLVGVATLFLGLILVSL